MRVRVRVSVSKSESVSESGSKSESVSESESENKDENEDNGNEDDENKEDENEDKNKDENEEYHIIMQTDYYFKTIDKSISLEEQINLLKKIKFSYEYWDMRYHDDDKNLNLKIFKIKLAYISNDIDENLFEEVFGCTFVTLANKLINKLYETDDFHNFVIQPNNKRIDLLDAAKLILRFCEIIQLDGD